MVGRRFVGAGPARGARSRRSRAASFAQGSGSGGGVRGGQQQGQQLEHTDPMCLLEAVAALVDVPQVTKAQLLTENIGVYNSEKLTSEARAASAVQNAARHWLARRRRERLPSEARAVATFVGSMRPPDDDDDDDDDDDYGGGDFEDDFEDDSDDGVELMR